MRQIILIIFSVLLCKIAFTQQIEKIANGANPNIPVYTSGWNDSIILRGNFNKLPDNTPSEGMAYWNGSKWKDLALNTTNSDRRVLVIFNGDLLLGGWLSFVGSSGSLPLMKLDGNTWVNVFGVTSSNSMGSINDMIVYKGELYVAGQLQRIGGKTVKNIAKWDGVAWSDVGGGCGGGVNEVNSLAILNNELYVGGFFENAGPKLAKHIAKWDGNSWSDLDSGVHQGAVSKIISYKDRLVVVGGFRQAGSYAHLSNIYKGAASWNGKEWSRIYGFMELAYQHAIQEYRGELFIGSVLASNTKTVNDTVMMSWDGTNYTNRLGADAEIYGISVIKDRLIITGAFTKMLTTSVSEIVSYYLEPVGLSTSSIKKPSFGIYPNPGAHLIHISNQSEYKNIKVVFYNSLSKKVKEGDLYFSDEGCSISIEELSSGMYYLQFFNEEVLLDVQKLMVR